MLGSQSLRNIIDTGILQAQEDPQDAAAKPKSAKPAKSGKASPLAKHVSEHMQDPFGATKQGFSDLTQKKLAYEQSKSDMARQLAPVKSVIQNVEQEHEITDPAMDEMNNPDLNPAAQPQAGMANKFGPDQGIPPGQAKQPGFGLNQNKPAANQNMPGAGPQKPVQNVQQVNPPAKSGAGPQMSPANTAKTDKNTRPGMQQPKNLPPKAQKKVHVTVSGNAHLAASNRSVTLAKSVDAERARTGLTCKDCGVKAGGPK